MKIIKYLFLLEFELGNGSKGVSGHLCYAADEQEAMHRVQQLAETVEKGKRFLGVRPLPAGFRTGVTGRLPNGDYHDDFYPARLVIAGEDEHA